MIPSVDKTRNKNCSIRSRDPAKGNGLENFGPIMSLALMVFQENVYHFLDERRTLPLEQRGAIRTKDKGATDKMPLQKY